MRVKNIINDIGHIPHGAVRDRIRRAIQIDGPITDLIVGRDYAVQALEERDGGWWLYLHTVAVNDFPYPYPAEMFELITNTIPSDWCLHLEKLNGSRSVKRLTFKEWATDGGYFERLV